MDREFRRGDLVNFIWQDNADSEKVQNKRNIIQKMNPYKLIILRPIDEDNYLVAVCRKQEYKTQMIVETNEAPLYINTKFFGAIDCSCLTLCNEIFTCESRFKIVEEIYALHNANIQEKKQKHLEKIRVQKEVQRKKHAKKKLERAEKRAQEKRYIAPYEFAIINNDLEQKQKIESLVGCAPGQKGSSRGLSKQNRQVLYSNLNPRPFSGGSCTPK